MMLYYIVMEYVRGQTLKELINKRGALHYVEAVDIIKRRLYQPLHSPILWVLFIVT